MNKKNKNVKQIRIVIKRIMAVILACCLVCISVNLTGLAQAVAWASETAATTLSSIEETLSSIEEDITHVSTSPDTSIATPDSPTTEATVIQNSDNHLTITKATPNDAVYTVTYASEDETTAWLISAGVLVATVSDATPADAYEDDVEDDDEYISPLADGEVVNDIVELSDDGTSVSVGGVVIAADSATEIVDNIKDPIVVPSATVEVKSGDSLREDQIPMLLAEDESPDVDMSVVTTDEEEPQWIDADYNTYTTDELMDMEITMPMTLYSLGDGIMPLSMGTASLSMVNMGGTQIYNAADFALGSSSSTSFTIELSMSTNEKEQFAFTIPYGFSAAIKINVDGFTMSQETQSNGDIIYTYKADTATTQGSYTCLVTTDYSSLLNSLSTTGRTEYRFNVDILSADGTSTSPAGGFTINLPTMSQPTIAQVDTNGGDFTWNPYQLAGTTVNTQIVHINRGDALNRLSKMTKPLQIQIDKAAGTAFPNELSLDIPLPLRMAISTVRIDKEIATIDLCINGIWQTVPSLNVENPSYTRVFKKVSDTTLPKSGYNTAAEPQYMLPSNMNLSTYVDTLKLSLKPDLVNGAKASGTELSLSTVTMNGTTKSIYEWLTDASGIRFNFVSDVMWDPVYDDQTPESQLTVDAIKDGTETYTASDVAKLTAGDYTKSSPSPFVMKVTNGTDQTLKVDVATIDKIQMGVTTTKTTTGSGGLNSNNNYAANIIDGYVAGFGTAKNNNYSYFTNMEASYDFPWEYSPVGEITLVPLSQVGNYDNERNLTCYDYEITISNTDGSTPTVIKLPHTGYLNKATGKTNTSAGLTTPVTYTPTLGPNQWVSNITVTADKVWKQTLTQDSSFLTTATANHPLFYANCASKEKDIHGVNHDDNDEVYVKSSIATDQTGLVQGPEKTVILVAPIDNAVLWGVDDSALRYPIGYYDDNKLEYIELHYKKYTDTPVYIDPYIEITGDALGILNKVTYASNVGTTTNYLTLRGYKLNDGSWVDVSASEAVALLNASEGYYDLSTKIGTGEYLVGLRLAPLEQNAATVDTLTAPWDMDTRDTSAPGGVLKQYMEKTYYLYLYDKVLPGYLGYDHTVAKTYEPASITTLDSPLSYDLAFHCDHITASHTTTSHLKDGMTANDTRSATLIYGDLPEKIFGRDNNYDILTSAPEVPAGWKKYYLTELTNVAIDDGPASSSTINAWGEMQNATLSFSASTAAEKRMLALTKGVSLIGRNWEGNSYQRNESLTATVRYKTNLNSSWTTVTAPYKVVGGSRDDRAVNYFPLAEGEYVTGIEVDYPVEFLYRAGYVNAGGPEMDTMMNLQLPDVGLLTQGQIPKESPVVGDDHTFHNGETFDYHAELKFTDLAGQEETLPLDYKTARLQPYPTMLVNKFTSSISYENQSDNASTYVYQGGVLNATLTHTYSFTADTKNIDTNKIIHPTLVYQIDKNFTIGSIDALAAGLGVNANQITLTPRADGSGDSILKIEYGPQGPQTRDINFNITLPLTTKPNAQVGNITPIKNAWLTLDYDKTLNVEEEDEYIDIDETSTQLEDDPGTIIGTEPWKTGDRLALVTTLNNKLNINKYQASSMVFAGTDGNGGGISQTVKGHDSTDDNVFGLTETLYAPSDNSTNWVIYVAVPSKGQKVPYASTTTLAKPSEYTLIPADEISLTLQGDDGVDTALVTMYYVPGAGKPLVPDMAALDMSAADTNASLVTKDDAANAGNGLWKKWEDLSDEDKLNVSYVRIIADEVKGEAQVSSSLLMKLKNDSAKTQVGDMEAYTSLIYNYIQSDSTQAFPNGTNNNMDPHGGKGSSLVTYVITDYVISGQLWHEKKFNNTFTTADADLLTSEFMELEITDALGNVIYWKDGFTENEVDLDTDDTSPTYGFYTALVPSKGTYYIKLTTLDGQDPYTTGYAHDAWRPVSYNGDNIMNAMKFKPGKDVVAGTGETDTTDEHIATAKVVVTNNDVQYINGGIEEWGTLKVTKSRTWTPYVDLTKEFAFTIKPNSGTIPRTYPVTIYTGSPVTSETKTFTAGSDNPVTLGDGDYLEMKLPVGLGYTVAETAVDFDVTITTSENGSETEHTITDSSGTAKAVTNSIVSITYDISEDGDGGNEETFTNKYKDVIPTGIDVGDSRTAIWILLGMFMLMIMTLFRYRKRRGGDRDDGS